jgi:hypothetical protein
MKRLFVMFVAAVFMVACSSTNSSQATSTRPARNQNFSVTLSGQTAEETTPSPLPPAVTSNATITQTVTTDNVSTASSSTLHIVDSQGYSMLDGYYIIGEVQNDGANPVRSVKVTAVYEYKFSGKPIMTLGTESTTALLDVIPPDGKAPFKLGPYTFGRPITMYELKVQGQTGNLARQDLVLQSSNEYSVGSWLYLRGEIKNTGDKNAAYVKAIITLYDPKGSVVGVISTYTAPDTIAAGGYSTFAVTTNYWPNFDHYSIQIQAQ